MNKVATAVARKKLHLKRNAADVVSADGLDVVNLKSVEELLIPEGHDIVKLSSIKNILTEVLSLIGGHI